MNPIRAARQAKSGNQPGDPAKAAQALLRLIEAEKPPIRLFLGDDALGLVAQKLEHMKTEMASWEALPAIMLLCEQGRRTARDERLLG